MFKILVNSIITLFILAYFLPNVSFSNWLAMIMAGLVLTLVNLIVRPIIKLLTLPLNIITFGLFSIVVNVFLIWLVIYLVPGFEIQTMVLAGMQLGSFGTLLIVSFVIGIIQSLVSVFIGGKK